MFAICVVLSHARLHQHGLAIPVAYGLCIYPVCAKLAFLFRARVHPTMPDAGGLIEGSFRHSFFTLLNFQAPAGLLAAPMSEFGRKALQPMQNLVFVAKPKFGKQSVTIPKIRDVTVSRTPRRVPINSDGFHCVSIQQVNPAARRSILKPLARARWENAMLPADSVPRACQRTIQSVGQAII